MTDTLHKSSKEAMRGIGASTISGLSKRELIDLLNKLRLFAAKHYYGQLDVDDLVMQAITEVLEGRRSWNGEYTPFQNLYWIIRSTASNQLKKEERIVSSNLDSEDVVDSLTVPAQRTPSEIYEANEAQRKFGDLLRATIRGDTLLGQIVGVTLDLRIWKPKEIAAELNISELEVYSARRRIQRRLAVLLNKSKGGTDL